MRPATPGWVVRGANRVAAHLLELADAVVLHGVRQRGTHTGMILVVAGALQLDGLAIHQKALLGVKFRDSNAEWSLTAIHHLPVRLNLGDQLVEIGRASCRERV